MNAGAVENCIERSTTARGLIVIETLPTSGSPASEASDHQPFGWRYRVFAFIGILLVEQFFERTFRESTADHRRAASSQSLVRRFRI